MILVRVSTKEQEQEGFSQEAQERYLRDYAQRADLNVVKVFFIAESASRADQRKTFNEAISYLKQRGILHFVCEKVDRLLRNFKDTVMVEDWLAADETRRLHAPKNSLILHKNSSSQEKLVWGMHVVIAKNYTDNLSEEVRKGQLEKLRQGWLPAAPPLGYESVTENGRRIQREVPALVPLIRKMFELAATKRYTLKSLSPEMAKRGLLFNGHPVTVSTLQRLLHNPYYIGVISWNGQAYPGSHTPIISVDLFERVQAALSRSKNLLPRYRKHHPLYQGLVACTACDGLLVWETAKGHWYGKCPKPRNCSRSGFVREEVIDAQILDHLRALKAPHPNLVAWLKTNLKATLDAELAGRRSAQQELEAEKERIGVKVATLYDDRLDGRITLEMYDAKVISLRAQQADVSRQMKSLDSEDTSYLDSALDFVRLTQSAADEYMKSRSIDHKRELISELFDGLSLHEHNLSVDYNRRARWALTDVVPVGASAKVKFEPDDNSSTKQKRASVEPLHSTWLAMWTNIRTLFKAGVNS
ncbi:recombinase family protein [Streptomyces xylophagus]|uniref:recombinase family protein n=1 Tax=Streptomyces xylophagus TaxID=285514 RepID=UPI0009962248|nr:recombinase family protein [Streptomyces xylophagus]